jgi:hypothetical protein
VGLFEYDSVLVPVEEMVIVRLLLLPVFLVVRLMLGIIMD